jgi:predicted Zn-dependent protease
LSLLVPPSQQELAAIAPLSLEEISDRLELILERSPADETELVWLEANRHRATSRGRKVEIHGLPECTVQVRVLDRGRVGSHRTGSGQISDLENAVRMAIAQSRSREPLPGLPHVPADDTPVAAMEDDLFDPEIAGLAGDRAGELLSKARRRRERLTLEWSDARVAVFNSRGVRRKTAVTMAAIEARAGSQPGGGRATAASRSLTGLALRQVVERSRQRHGSGALGELPTEPVPAVLSPETAAALCDIVNRVAFSAISYYDGSSFLRQHLNVQVFGRDFSLRDDATDPAGLPFPFDLEGSAKRPVDLIFKGTPKTPALDQRQAALLGLKSTAHAIAGNDARALNLFLSTGSADEEELLRAADGGVWIGWLDHLECFEPTRVQIRTHARGVRRIRDGRLAEPLPDLVWEDGLLRTFSSLLAVGKETVLCSSPEGYLGGISAPALAISGVGDLRPL